MQLLQHQHTLEQQQGQEVPEHWLHTTVLFGNIINRKMKAFIILSITAVFILSLVFYQRDQKSDLILFKNRSQRNTNWKLWANVIKGCFLSLLLFLMYWKDVFIITASLAIVFELLTNKIGLGAPWFYVGASSEFDKIGRYKWWLLFIFLLLTIFIKLIKLKTMLLSFLDSYFLGIPVGVYIVPFIVFGLSLYSYRQSDKDRPENVNSKPPLQYKKAATWAIIILAIVWVIAFFAN